MPRALLSLARPDGQGTTTGSTSTCSSVGGKRGSGTFAGDRWPELGGGGVRVFLGLGDGAAANLGSKCVDASRLCVTVGTSAALRVVLPSPCPRPHSPPPGPQPPASSPSSSPVDCPGGHGLRVYSCPADDKMACSKCSRKLKKGEAMHGCRQCRFTVCSACQGVGGAKDGGKATSRSSNTSSFRGETGSGPASKGPREVTMPCPGDPTHGPLRSYAAPKAMTCGSCGTSIEATSKFYGCKACRKSLCVKCAIGQGNEREL